ncbi:hypothetical protein QMM87_17410 [Leptospira santarosai]|uniref:hypothetical protein n=1 Tax=Leptospira santarosai TaxID=28183 RepID=UPI0024AF33B0|nr:hypothetical protein [Leptospira santarosai]MDI7230416.1 hypothetical protein [Leptospira santarosai]
MKYFIIIVCFSLFSCSSMPYGFYLEQPKELRNISKHRMQIQKVTIDLFLEDKEFWESITYKGITQYLSIQNSQLETIVNENVYNLNLIIKGYKHTIKPNWGTFSLGILTLTISWLLGGKVAHEELELSGIVEFHLNEKKTGDRFHLAYSKKCEIDRSLYDRRPLPPAYTMSELANPRIKGRKFGPECWQQILDSILLDIGNELSKSENKIYSQS